jgi:UDP-glucose 4-epimerase
MLVTGAAGFIGSHVSDRLLADGHHVVGIDNLLTGRADNFAGELHVEDICDRDVLYGIANRVKPELVVHCAASYSNPDYWHRDTDTNVTGTINTTIAAKHHGARLIYFQTALPPISSYAISKIAGEQYIVLSGVDHTIFRLANMYGPRNVSGPVPTFWKRLTNGEPCTVVDTRRDMVYVDDLVDAVMSAIEREAFGKFDICSGEHLPIEDLYWAVANVVGVAVEPGRHSAGSDDVKQMELDGLLARDVLGWAASTPLFDGIASAVDWYERTGVETTHTHLKLKG